MNDPEMDRLERAWKAGSLRALVFAVACCHGHRPLPDWASRAVLRLLAMPEKQRRGRLAQMTEADRQNRIHFTRWDTVSELRERKDELAKMQSVAVAELRQQWPDYVPDYDLKPTWEAAYENAAKALHGTFAAGSSDTMKRSYMLVERLMKSGEGAAFAVSTDEYWGNEGPLFLP